MEKNLLPVGTAIYYTGDVANHEGFGEIAGVHVSAWATQYEVLFEDGRKFFVMAGEFDYDGPGIRFMTKAKYEAKRAEKIARMQAEYKVLQEKGLI